MESGWELRIHSTSLTRSLRVQVTSLVRQAARRAVLESGPCLVEAMSLCQVSTASEALAGVLPGSSQASLVLCCQSTWHARLLVAHVDESLSGGGCVPLPSLHCV